jgi:hypothetical protein
MISHETIQERLKAAIWMYRYYRGRAYECWDIHPEIEDACCMFDYHMTVAEGYKTKILELLEM